MQTGGDGGPRHGAGSRRHEKWWRRGCILRVQPPGFPAVSRVGGRESCE